MISGTEPPHHFCLRLTKEVHYLYASYVPYGQTIFYDSRNLASLIL